MKNVLITGAGSGLGRGLALGLAVNGHHLIVSDRDPASAAETQRLIDEAGGSAESLALDVLDEHAVNAAFEGRQVDVLVNNAGIQHVSSVEEFSVEKWDQVVGVLLRGTFLATRAALPGMRSRGFGRIVHIGSIHSLVASPFKSAYVAAKHGVLGFSKVLALETADVDITSNVICPSYLLTPLVEKQIQDQARTRGIPEDEVINRVMLEPMPKKAFIEADEIAAAVEYLLSPQARNFTGQTITIDGGWTAR